MSKKKTIAELYQLTSKNLVDFRRGFLPAQNELSPAPFHYDWSNSFLNKTNHVAYEGYRESGKTSIILRAGPLYTLTFPRPEWDFIVIIKANQREARRALKNITAEYMGNPYLRCHLKKTIQKSSDVFEVDLGHHGIKRIEVYGKGASIRGLNNRDKRPSLIIMDDVQDTEDMRSEVIPENDWDWFLSDVLFLGQTTRIFMIGNNLGERCIIEKIAADPKKWGFDFHRIPCCDDEMTTPTWADQTTIEEIKKERDTFAKDHKLDIWLREKMCQAVNEEIKVFKDEMYKYYTPALKYKLADAGQVFAALDPASSKRKDSCLRAIVVGSLMDDGAWYILDVRYGRWDSIELMNEMFSVVQRWGIKDFGVEKGQYQQVLEPILYREMSRRGIRFLVEPLEHGKIGSKLERIKSLAPIFKSNGIWFPDNADWLGELKKELHGVTKTEIKSEYIDLVDALAMLVNQMRPTIVRTHRDIANIKNLQRQYIT